MRPDARPVGCSAEYPPKMKSASHAGLAEKKMAVSRIFSPFSILLQRLKNNPRNILPPFKHN
jgi:hypothetical protein